MPGYKGHLTGGLAVYALAVYGVSFFVNPSWIMLIEWCACTLSGSLFPDIDTKSKGQKLFYSIMTAIMMLLLVRGCYDVMAGLAMLLLVPILSRHRGLFHKPWFIVSFVCAVAYGASLCVPLYAHMFYYDALFFITGALSHVWLDIGTRRMFKK